MIEKEFINKVIKLLPNDPNQIPNWACQEDLFLSLPISIFKRMITTVITGSQSSASSLRAYINVNGIQKRKIRIIHEKDFSNLRPCFDVLIIEKNTRLIGDFISWLNGSKYYSPQKIKVIKKTSINNLQTLSSTWDRFTKNWVYTEMAFDINVYIQQRKSSTKFLDEEVEEDENE